MIYKILADIIVFFHFVWILFMLWGFFRTFLSIIFVYIIKINCKKWELFFDRWFFRTLHLGGIVYVGFLSVLGKYCPLTMLENFLIMQKNPDLKYPGSFIVYHIEKLVYPDINPKVIIIPTICIAVFTIAVFIIKPPDRIRKKFS